jgi:MYXO-CTERM domain-containing protein
MAAFRVPSLIASLAALLTVLAASASAGAYCRTKACDTEASYGDVWDETPDPAECVRDRQGCLIEGEPLYWPSTCISFGVQRDGSASSSIDFETIEAVIEDAFAKWASVDCGGDAPGFRSVNRGEISCHVAEYNQDAPNANVFMFRDDDWPYAGGIDTLALTTITYNVETAEIYDADVEMNSFQATFTTSDDPLEILSDLSSVVTHEVGHFLGLSHSAEDTAVMRGIGYRSGSIDMRTLTDDDIFGICEIYPPGRPSDSCGPRHGFSRECGVPQEKEGGGCAVASTPGGSDPRWFAAFAGVGLFLALRRARGRRERGECHRVKDTTRRGRSSR